MGVVVGWIAAAPARRSKRILSEGMSAGVASIAGARVVRVAAVVGAAGLGSKKLSEKFGENFEEDHCLRVHESYGGR